MSRANARGLLSQINAVPYVDVMLVLLVIFMISTPLLTQGVIVDLPNVAADPVDAANEPLVLTVDNQGRFYLSFGGAADEPLDERTLLERAGAALLRDAASPIFVRGDEAATHGRIMQGIALLRRAGARQVALLAEPL